MKLSWILSSSLSSLSDSLVLPEGLDIERGRESSKSEEVGGTGIMRLRWIWITSEEVDLSVGRYIPIY